MNDLDKALSEMLDILEILGDSYKKDLPKKMLKFIKDNSNKDYQPGITEDDFRNRRFLETTQILLAIFYINYWASPEVKQQYMEEIRLKDQEYQEKHKMVINELFPERDYSATIEPNNTQKDIADVKANSFIVELLNKLKAMFSK